MIKIREKFYNGMLNQKNKVDEIAAYHDIYYDKGTNKGDCDKQFIRSFDYISYKEMPKWGQTAIFLINTKQKKDLERRGNSLQPPKGKTKKKKREKVFSNGWAKLLAEELFFKSNAYFQREELFHMVLKKFGLQI